ncbi:hypothetical protein [Nitrosomonas sp. Is37]|uniref:hypothetical protein n=1 Tax=Nitrosomonas sp. Is37 TaxID=3080535 RepID=UPI00294AA1C3|nr:hypothetical protein [Nitrosomonas sp. Is37]MDV6343156.1 hypothetical protein [Nitrosomonas sp. Is37]
MPNTAINTSNKKRRDKLIGQQNMGQPTVYDYVRNRLLDFHSTTLRGRPDLLGTARRPGAAEACAAKHSLSSAALCYLLPPGSHLAV